MADSTNDQFFYKHAFFQFRKSNDALLDASNGLDYSAKGLASKINPSSLLHLREMISILAVDNETTSTSSTHGMHEHTNANNLDYAYCLQDLFDEYIATSNSSTKSINFEPSKGHPIQPDKLLSATPISIDASNTIGASRMDSFLDSIEAAILPLGKNYYEQEQESINELLHELLQPCKAAPTAKTTVATATLNRNKIDVPDAKVLKQNDFTTAKHVMTSSNDNSNHPNASKAYSPNSVGVSNPTATSKSLGSKRGRTGNNGINSTGATAAASKYGSKPNDNMNPADNNDISALENKLGFYNSSSSVANNTSTKKSNHAEAKEDERLNGLDARIVEMIKNEIMHQVDHISWDDIAGLEHAKNTIKEIVVWPMLRPDIFTGLRGPPKGLLLFGPPGTGKTMIGKCIASQARATFFSISASSLTSKWVGEGEKLVRALFTVARCNQPAVIFIDEIDSLLGQRSEGEFEASRRIKTEFLVQFDGASTHSSDRILVIGATNRPQEIDEAARRRLVKRLYIPLPDWEARATIIRNLLRGCSLTGTNDKDTSHQAVSNAGLPEDQIKILCEKTEGYSGSDVDNLCREAALGPIRSIRGNILDIDPSQVRPISLTDFEYALTQVRASVSKADLDGYLEWNKKFGSLSIATEPVEQLHDPKPHPKQTANS